MMEAAEPVLWAFFFGVIAVSVLQIGAARPPRYLAAYGALGLLAGLLFLSLPSVDMSGSMFALFIAGMVAVSAWILPGISGSFVLLLLGLYDDVILAVNQLDWTFLLVLAGGCGSGLLLFTRALGWLLMRFEDALLAFLTGFMATALIKLWPWQIVASQSAPDAYDVFHTLQSPQQYAAAGNEAYLGLSLMAALLGGAGIWLLSKLSPQ
jgi:putative membrane protein